MNAFTFMMSMTDIKTFFGKSDYVVGRILVSLEQIVKMVNYDLKYTYNTKRNMMCVETPLRIGYQKDNNSLVLQWLEADQYNSKKYTKKGK